MPLLVDVQSLGRDVGSVLCKLAEGSSGSPEDLLELGITSLLAGGGEVGIDLFRSSLSLPLYRCTAAVLFFFIAQSYSSCGVLSSGDTEIRAYTHHQTAKVRLSHAVISVGQSLHRHSGPRHTYCGRQPGGRRWTPGWPTRTGHSWHPSFR